MIRSVAEFLGELIERERETLGAETITHAPTIGAMYEGLTADVLGRVVPEELGLQVTKGFIHAGTDELSGEIDCMVTVGEGVQVPFTSLYKWHIKDVLAVIEVKKTLYGQELADAFAHLQTIKQIQHRYIQGEDPALDLTEPRTVYSQITGVVAPPHPDVPAMLPATDQALYHTLIVDYFTPRRIVIGYEGFKTEFGFRESLWGYLQKNFGTLGFGPGSYPDLIMSGAFSLVKAGGSPWTVPAHGGGWDFYFSSRTNPITFLLEILWTQLDRRFGVEGLWGEDLDMEVGHPFLTAHPAEIGGSVGWQLQYHELGEKELSEGPDWNGWQPARLSALEAVVLNALIHGKEVSFADPELAAMVSGQGFDMNALRAGLLATNLVAFNGDRCELTTEECAIALLPSGDCVAGENNTGRLTRWVERNFSTTDNG